MKNRISTLTVPTLFLNRRTGNSTRQIDYAIQSLFGRAIVEVRDHAEGGNNKNANKNLFDRILRRLNMEHNLQHLIEKREIRIDSAELELELL